MPTAKDEFMKLTEAPDILVWPETHYVFVEKIGPFQNNALQCWQDLLKHILAISAHNAIGKYFILYNGGKPIYRAGVSPAAPKNLPVDKKETGT